MTPADVRKEGGAAEATTTKKKSKRGSKTVRIQEPEHTGDKRKKRGKRPAALDLTQGDSDSDGQQGSYPMTPQTPQMRPHVTQSSGAYRRILQTQVSGGALTNSPVVFSADSSVFFLAKDSAVAVYNVQNGEVVQTFGMAAQGEQRAAEVHAVVAGRRAKEVYTFSADARVRLWDGDSARVLGEWALDEAAVLAVADGAEAEDGVQGFFCAVRRGKRASLRAGGDKAKYAVVHVRLGEKGEVHVREVFRMAGVVGLAAGQRGAWVGAFGKFRVQLAHVARAGEPAVHVWHLAERVSTLAFHPAEAAVAVGDWRGRIVQWFCLDSDAAGSTDRRVAQQPMHWHARRVNAVVFAGSHVMLSGGDEGVLVVWQLATGSRTCLSALGSEIMGIAVSSDAALYALTMRDNTVRVVAAADRALVAVVQGLEYAQPAQGASTRRLARRLAGGALTSGLVVHPTTHALALGGPGHVQLFSHARDRHVARISVAPYTRVSTAPAPHVALVQFSCDGAWMATVDARDGSTCFLKFWALDARSQQYRLATRVDMPHAGGVRALAFQPGDRPLCVTAGRDACARVWQQGAGGAWTCVARWQFRGLQPGAAAFSADGSTAAVAFGAHVTLWDAQKPVQAAPQATLLASADAPRLRGLRFVAHTAYLAAWSRARMDVWNMLTGSVWWTLAARVRCVAERLGVLAVAAHVVKGCAPVVMLLDPEHPQPLATVLAPAAGGVEALALVPARERLAEDAPDA
ncbi:NET1-associated nuclear protein 1, partial [Coemansia sp. RSA 2703]